MLTFSKSVLTLLTWNSLSVGASVVMWAAWAWYSPNEHL